MVLGREPIWRKVEDRLSERASTARQRVLNDPLERRVPRVGQRNIGEGIGAGLIEAGIAVILEETLGVPFGASSDIVDTTPVDGGMVYTVNVNAPVENMAKARAFIDSTTGFLSILTDNYEIDNAEVLNTRMLRDTYQIELLVED